MAQRETIGAVAALSFALAGAVCAQGAEAIASREVVGQWTLRITPAQRRGFSVSVGTRDGGRPDLALAITARSGDALTCTVGGDPAECNIGDGDLVITSARPGGARMIFTLTDRARGGFAGTARVRARLLPFGSAHVGTVTMARR